MRLPCLLAIVLQCTVITITAQTKNRLSGSDYILAVNNIKVSLDPSGAIGYSNYNPFYFHVPANGNVPAMYGGFFWLRVFAGASPPFQRFHLKASRSCARAAIGI